MSDVLSDREPAEVTLRPRNDYVLVRIVDLGETRGGIATPQVSIQGKEFRVVATGPLVEDLQPGDKVLMIGKSGQEYFPLPTFKDLIILKQECVVLRLE